MSSPGPNSAPQEHPEQQAPPPLPATNPQPVANQQPGANPQPPLNPQQLPPPLPGTAPNPGRPPVPGPRPPAGARAMVRPRSESASPFQRGLGAGLGLALGAGLVAMALLVVSLLGSLLLGLGRGNNEPAANSFPTAHVWGPANASNTLLAISISGAIEGTGGGSLFGAATYGYEIADQLDALDAEEFAGVILLMDTPGGSIYGSRAIADAVIRYQERTGNQVIAYVQSMSASGGMYAMAPADVIIADHGTMIGSIGVIMGPFSSYRDVTGLTGNILESGVLTEGGITQEYLTQGRGKDFGNPFREMTEEEREVYGNGMAIEYENFVNFVAEHRGIPAETIVDDLGAHLYDPITAVDKGLVDQIMGRSDGFRAAAEANEADPSDTKVVAPALLSGWAAFFGAEQRVWGHNIPIDPSSGALPTSQLCVGAPVVLAYTGDFRASCGA